MSGGRPIRLCVVEPSGRLYGSERVLLDWIDACDRTRLALDAVVPRGAPLAAELRARGVPVREDLPADLLRATPARKAWAYARVLASWAAHRPDVLWVNQAGAIRAMDAMARCLRLPILCMVQTVEDAGHLGRCYRASSAIRAIVCNSEYTAARTGLPSERLSVVYPAYRSLGLSPAARERAPGPPWVVGAVGRLCATKGADVLLEAMRLLEDARPGQFRLQWVGAAPDEAEALRYRNRVAELKLDACVELRGFRADMAAEYAAMDIVAIPSTAEAFGRVLLESAEAGLPAVVSDVEGLGEAARRFGIGRVVEPGVSRALAEAIGAVVLDYAHARAATAEAGKKALAALRPARHAEVMSGLIERVAEGAWASARWLGGEADGPR